MVFRAETPTTTEIDVPLLVHPRATWHAVSQQHRDQKERTEVAVGHKQIAGRKRIEPRSQQGGLAGFLAGIPPDGHVHDCRRRR